MSGSGSRRGLKARSGCLLGDWSAALSSGVSNERFPAAENLRVPLRTTASHRIVHRPALRAIPMHRRCFVLEERDLAVGRPASKQGVGIQKF